MANTDLPFQFPVTSLIFQVTKLVNVLGSIYLSDHQGDFLHQNNEIVNENKEALHKHALILGVMAQPSCRLLAHKVQQMTQGSMSVCYTWEQPSTYLTTPTGLSLTSTIIVSVGHRETIGKAKSWRHGRFTGQETIGQALVTAGAKILSEEGSLSLRVNHPAPTTHLSLPAVLLPLINGCDNVGTSLNE